MVHEEQGALRNRGAGAEYAVHPGRGFIPSEDQPVHRRGCAALRRLALANLPRHPVLAGQEPLQDGGRDAFLALEGRGTGAHGPGFLPPHDLRGDDGRIRGVASRSADFEEDPRPDRRGTGRLEKGVTEPRVDRRGVPATTAARLRPEPSLHPGPAAEGLHRDTNVPRQPGHKPRFLRVVPRDVRVDGPAEQLPGGGHRASLVRKGRYKTAHRPNPLGGGISNVGWTMTFAVFVIKGGKGSRPLCATKTISLPREEDRRPRVGGLSEVQRRRRAPHR